jgi:xanthine dehydrogenase iron-sulfur cluster and FAD-binding subunit A
MRASAAYRMRVAQNLLQRFFLEHNSTPYPVRLGIRYAPEQMEQRGEGDGAGA